MPAITMMVSAFDLDIDSIKPTSVCILKRSEMEEDSFSCGLEFCFFIQPPVVNFPGTANFKLRGADAWGIMAKPPRV